jgi:hypothetical protein
MSSAAGRAHDSSGGTVRESNFAPLKLPRGVQFIRSDVNYLADKFIRAYLGVNRRS